MPRYLSICRKKIESKGFCSKTCKSGGFLQNARKWSGLGETVVEAKDGRYRGVLVQGWPVAVCLV